MKYGLQVFAILIAIPTANAATWTRVPVANNSDNLSITNVRFTGKCRHNIESAEVYKRQNGTNVFSIIFADDWKITRDTPPAEANASVDICKMLYDIKPAEGTEFRFRSFWLGGNYKVSYGHVAKFMMYGKLAKHRIASKIWRSAAGVPGEPRRGFLAEGQPTKFEYHPYIKFPCGKKHTGSLSMELRIADAKNANPEGSSEIAVTNAVIKDENNAIAMDFIKKPCSGGLTDD